MTARPGVPQTSFNAGEIDPAALRSTQLKPYYAGARTMQRLRPRPQGGLTLMPGSRWRADLALGVGQPVRLIPFEWSRDRAYMIALYAGAIVIRHASTGGFAASATLGSPYAAGDIVDVTWARLDDTMILFHPDHAPQRLRRLGDNVWSIDAAPWTDVPLVDYGGTYTTVAEVWRLTVSWPTSNFTFGFRTLEVTVDGETTPPISLGVGTPAAIAASADAIRDGLLQLPSIEAGVTVVDAGSPASGVQSWDITFGGDNAGGTYSVAARIPTSTDVSASCSRLTAGDPGGEAIMSSTRGWPSCGVFVQGRLILAGFRSEPAALLMSRVGEYFDLNIKATAASGAILTRMDLDGGERIHRLRRGKHLCIFTTQGEWFVPERTIARGQPFTMARSSGVGARRGAPVLEQEGDLMFANPTGTKIFAAAYSDVSQGYSPSPISLLASHLVRGVVDMAVQASDSATDADRLWIVNADGGMTCGHLLRNQDVVGFTPWTSPDPVRAVAVDATGVVWIAVERGALVRLETLEEGLALDAAVTAAAPAATVSGLAHLEGRSVHAIADGWPVGPLPVTAGVVALPAAAASATVGVWTPPRLDPLPVPRDVAERRVLRRPARVHGVRVDLAGASDVAVSANGGALRELSTWRFGDLADTPPQPFDGELRLTGLARYTEDTQVTITQVRPGPFTLRAITLEARL